MKITLTKAELRNAVAGLAKIIPSKTGIAALGCVRFYVEGGDLKAQATDLDQTLVFRFDCAECEGLGEIIAGFPVLRELAKGAGTDTVTLEQDGDKVMVTNSVGGHAVTSTAEGMDPRDWPESGAEIEVGEAKGFLNAYRRMAPFASADETRRTLQCVYVDVGGDGERNATLVATDGKRLCCCNSLKLSRRWRSRRHVACDQVPALERARRGCATGRVQNEIGRPGLRQVRAVDVPRQSRRRSLPELAAGGPGQGRHGAQRSRSPTPTPRP
jgi:hypothetical protein